MKRVNHNGKIVAVLFILSPLLVTFVIYAVTGYSPWNTDAWNTSWNDEGGYWRCVRMMRMYGVPQGVTGFNEDAGRFLAYGPYNVLTYIPYYLVSFLTGYSAHNYIYACNVILAILANLIFVLLARPDRRRSLFLFLFEMTFLIWARYIWSGMIEESYCFFAVVLAGLAVCYLRKLNTGKLSRRAGTLLLVFMVSVTVFWSIMRPYYLPLIILPFFLSLFRFPEAGRARRIILAAVSVGGAVFTLVIFLYLNNNYVARYFFASTQVETLEKLLGSGSLTWTAGQIVGDNITRFVQIGQFIHDLRWQGIVTLIMFCEWGILIAMAVHAALSGRKAKRKSGLVLTELSLVLGGFIAFEGTIVLYQGVQLHRMMLAFTVLYAFIIIELCGRTKWAGGRQIFFLPPSVLEIAVAVLMILIVTQSADTHAFYPPQKSSDSITASEREKTEEELAAALPHVTGGSPWENTVAKETEIHNLQYTFMMPAYMSFNVCQRSVLYDKIDKGTLKSRYVVLPQDSQSVSLCDIKGYTRIWEGYGRILFRRE